MNLRTEIDVASRLISVTGKALGHSFFWAQCRREIIRADFDIADPDRFAESREGERGQ